jgi:hypothetical protein
MLNTFSTRSNGRFKASDWIPKVEDPGKCAITSEYCTLCLKEMDKCKCQEQADQIRKQLDATKGPDLYKEVEELKKEIAFLKDLIMKKEEDATNQGEESQESGETCPEESDREGGEGESKEGSPRGHCGEAPQTTQESGGESDITGGQEERQDIYV